MAFIQISQLLFSYQAEAFPPKVRPMSHGPAAEVWPNLPGPVLGGLQGSGVLTLGTNKGHLRAELRA